MKFNLIPLLPALIITSSEGDGGAAGLHGDKEFLANRFLREAPTEHLVCYPAHIFCTNLIHCISTQVYATLRLSYDSSSLTSNIVYLLLGSPVVVVFV